MGDFDYLNCLHSFITENKLKIYEKSSTTKINKQMSSDHL